MSDVPAAQMATSGVFAECSRRGANEKRLGSKANEATYKTIINQIPPHHTYIEPFLGWGAIMLHKAPARHSICVDMEEAKVKNFHLEVAAAHPTIAAAIVSIADAAWSTSGNQAAGISSAELPSVPTKTCALVVGNSVPFLASYPWRGDEFVYCDPPYLMETRSSRRSRYLFDMETTDHIALLNVLRRIPAKVMLSGYHSQLYEKALKKWRVITFNATTRSVVKRVRVEYLWCNFPEPVELHDYRYLGRNFRERQDLNRMRKRWTAKLSKMPLLKQRALFAAIKDFHDRQPRQP